MFMVTSNKHISLVGFNGSLLSFTVHISDEVRAICGFPVMSKHSDSL